ncbi:MAG: hypothetical protein EPN60_16465 [Nevskiaceae bacterium]|nr:MAG: hypothetical protein EPO48_02705 [Nevskiaceae bacterium]TAM22725.1 MAG: hypothetical protein EPN60_16465 [Nevskiaceae bacterium]
MSGSAPGHDHGHRYADYDRTERDGGSAIYDYEEANRSQELRLRYTADERLRGPLGVYAARIAQYAYNETVDPIPTGGSLTLLSGYRFSDQTIETVAGFGEFDWGFTETLTLTAGLRYQLEESRHRQVSQLDYALSAAPLGLPLMLPLPEFASDLLDQLLPDPVPSDYDVSGGSHHPVWLPKLGLAWQLARDHRLALSWQKGYRSGGTSVSFFGGTRSDFCPEYTQMLELALRSALPAWRAALNANVFYTRWKDQQVTLGDEASFYTTTANAGCWYLYGAEVELNAKPFDNHWLRGLEPFASLGLLHSRFDELSNGGENYAGNSFPYAAPLTSTLGTHYRLGGFFAFAAATHKGAYYGRNLSNDLNLQDRFETSPDSNRRVAKRYGELRLIGAAMELAL